MTMNFTVMPFILLEIGKSLEGWHTLYYYGVFAVVVPMIAFRAGLGKTMDEMSGVAAKKKKERGDNSKIANGNGNHQVMDVDAVHQEVTKAGAEATGKLQDQIKKSKKDL
jgi:lysophospholipid acyltransferase